MALNSEEEDDPVVHEIDVFMAKALADRVYLFQYPVRPSFLPYDDTDHLSAKFKPKQQKVELELALDVNNPTYCVPRGEQIAYAVDEASTTSKISESYYQSGFMDKQVLSSVNASEANGRYVAAVLKHGGLHLTPISGFVQLRPSFEYLDKADENKQTTSSVNIEENNEDEEEAKLVTTRFAKPDLDPTNKKRRQNLQSVEQKLAEEPWVKVEYHQPTTTKAASERILLYCHQKDFESPEFTSTSREYLKILTPKPDGKESHRVELPHGVLSMASLRKMHIADQIKALLTNAKIIQFQHLMALLGPGSDEKTLLKGLNDYAVLVQGCWVVRSEILYPKGSKCQVSGIDAELIWPARNFILWRFNHKRIIERKEILSVVRIPSEELRDMLEQIARQKPPQSWEFMLPSDTDFLIKHQDVVKLQMEVWKDLLLRFRQSLNIIKDITIADHDTLPGLDASTTKNKLPRIRSRSRENVERPRRTSGNEEERMLSKKSKNIDNISKSGERKEEDLLNKTLFSNDNSSGTQKIQVKVEPCEAPNVKEEPLEWNDVAGQVSSSEMVIDSDNEEISKNDFNNYQGEGDSNSSSNSIPFIPPAASGKTPLAVDKPPSDIFLQELDKFIKITLKGGCLCLAEFKEILQLHQQEPGNILCSGVTDAVLEQELLKVGASKVDVKWPENVSVHPDRKKVFAFWKVGDSNDKYRKIALAMFKGGFGFKRAEVSKLFQEKLGSSLTNHQFPRFMGEFCEKYGNSWYLRGTFKAAYPNS